MHRVDYSLAYKPKSFTINILKAKLAKFLIGTYQSNTYQTPQLQKNIYPGHFLMTWKHRPTYTTIPIFKKA